MLPIQFFGQNIHFAICLFAALVFFAIFWLYVDAWTASRNNKEFIKISGFLLVALSFVLEGTVIEQSVLGDSMFGSISDTLSTVLRIAGYVGIIIGQLIDPLQKIPQMAGLETAQFNSTPDTTPQIQPQPPTPAPIVRPLPAVGFGSVANISNILLPLSALTIAGLYWRRATTGLERHLKPVAIGFLFLTIFEALSLAGLWQMTSNPTVGRLVAAFGPIWIAEQAFLLIGAVVLGRWVWRYLTRRFFSQLFMVFTTLTLVIFLVTTVSFTFLLVRNVQSQSLDNLQTASNVLKYALSAKEAETLANASSVAESPEIVNAVVAKDNKALVSLTSTFLEDKKQSSLIITTASGQVLLRAEDPTRFGDSLSSDTLIRRASIGESSSSIGTQSGVLAPQVYVKSTIPIRDASNKIVGTATVSLGADNAFVDGIKRSTGLDSAVFAGNVRSATTFVAPDGVSRLVGVKDTNKAVENTVIKQGKSLNGSVNVLNRQYLAVYAPLKDIDNTTVGMLFIGKPQASILQQAGRSIELTFVVTAILLLLSILPAFMISKYIARQLD